MTDLVLLIALMAQDLQIRDMRFTADSKSDLVFLASGGTPSMRVNSGDRLKAVEFNNRFYFVNENNHTCAWVDSQGRLIAAALCPGTPLFEILRSML